MKSKYRVGTLSAGILFIALGIGLLVSQWQDYSLIPLFFTWWPILLVLLGAEILVYSFLLKNKEEEHKIKYDFISMSILVVFSFVSIAIYTIQESAVLPMLRETVFTGTYDIQSDPQFIENLTEINKVKIVGNPHHAKITATNEQKITMYSHWRYVSAPSKEKAEQSTNDLILTELEGDTLYITLKQMNSTNRMVGTPSGTMTLYIPSTVEVEVDFESTDVNLLLENFQNNWRVSTLYGNINTQITEVEDITVTALSYDGEIYPSENWNNKTETETQASFTAGEGKYHLDLISQRGQIQLHKQ